jgi:SAM-dependent methyltransferase
MTSDYRSRLYEAYASTHAGVAHGASGLLAFKRDIARHLPADRSAAIVDLGCGQGLLVRHLLAAGYASARGIDISPEQVQLAHAAGIHQVELGDFRAAFEAESLDGVVATDFFEHLTKSEVVEAFDHVYESLRPGGVLILRVPNSVSPFAGNFRHGDMTHETSYTPKSIRQLAATSGFNGTTTIHPCNPPVHGLASLARSLIWSWASGVMKILLAAETGQLHGHVVTQNVVGVLHKRPGNTIEVQLPI